MWSCHLFLCLDTVQSRFQKKIRQGTIVDIWEGQRYELHWKTSLKTAAFHWKLHWYASCKILKKIKNITKTKKYNEQTVIFDVSLQRATPGAWFNSIIINNSLYKCISFDCGCKCTVRYSMIHVQRTRLPLLRCWRWGPLSSAELPSLCWTRRGLLTVFFLSAAVASLVWTAEAWKKEEKQSQNNSCCNQNYRIYSFCRRSCWGMYFTANQSWIPV